MDKVRVFAPASIANLSCGFDVLGLAVEHLGDEVEMEFSADSGISLEVYGDNKKLSLKPEENTCTAGLISMLAQQKTKKGIKVKLYKKLPLGSGLGSSAASAVAGVFALNNLLGNPYSKYELLPFALEGEAVASKCIHADNVAPSLLGGLILVKSCMPLDIINIDTNINIHCVLINPDLVVNTADARRVLPKEVSLKTAVKQWAHLAGLVAAFFKNDVPFLKRSMQDFIIEPNRAHLIPHFYEVKEVALKNDAIGCSIGGSGPTIFALTDNVEKAKIIATEMQKPFEKNKIKSKAFISKINYEGAKLI